LKVEFEPVEGKTIKGMYQLKGSNVWDSALRFTGDMYKPGQHICVSFTGPYKHFKLSKGGAILTDDHRSLCCGSKEQDIVEDVNVLITMIILI
jgi:hypothetical protein